MDIVDKENLFSERFRQIVLLVGSGDQAARFARMVDTNRQWGLEILGVLNEDGVALDMGLDLRFMGGFDQLTNVLHNNVVDRVVFFPEHCDNKAIQKYIYLCELEGVDVSVSLAAFDRRIAKTRVEMVGGQPFISFETTTLSVFQRTLKRFMDVMLSGAGIVICGPLMILTAIAIKISSSGPVLFSQERMGFHGRTFELYKFRSMCQDAEKHLEELRGLNEADGPVFKIRNDPRVTSIGRFIRKLSIDELPQLFNVFKGDMSLVGPRPPLPCEVEQYATWHRRRLSVRPGLTCLWQINGRSDKVDFYEWMRLDMKYLDNWSLWLDVMIIFKTIPAVVFGRGAY